MDKIKYTYALCLDEGYDGDKVAELFIPDSLWSISGVGGTARGRDGIRQHTNNLGRDILWGQHNILAPVIDIAPDSLSAVEKFNLICLLTMMTSRGS